MVAAPLPTGIDPRFLPFPAFLPFLPSCLSLPLPFLPSCPSCFLPFLPFLPFPSALPAFLPSCLSLPSCLCLPVPGEKNLNQQRIGNDLDQSGAFMPEGLLERLVELAAIGDANSHRAAKLGILREVRVHQ